MLHQKTKHTSTVALSTRPHNSSQFGAALPNQDSLWVGWERDPHWIVSAMAPTHEQQAPTTVSLGTSWLYKTASLLEAFKVSWSSSYSDFCQSHFLESKDQVYWTKKRLNTVPNLNLISSFFVFILQPKPSQLIHIPQPILTLSSG